MDQPQQDVLGADVVVVQHPRFFLSEDHDSPGPVGKPFEHLHQPSGPANRPTGRSTWGSADPVLPPRRVRRSWWRLPAPPERPPEPIIRRPPTHPDDPPFLRPSTPTLVGLFPRSRTSNLIR